MPLRTTSLSFAVLLATGLATTAAETNNILEFERKKLSDTCQDVVFMPGFIEMMDLNGDGIDDSIIDYDYLQCDGSNIQFCGSGGCTVRFYAGLPGNRYAEAGEFLSYGLRTIGRGRNMRLAIRVGGGDCGRANAASCTLDAALVGQRIVVRGRRAGP